MSYLSRPRAYFSGKFAVNTATANNSTADYNNQVYFDVAGVKLDWRTHGNTPAEFRQWFMQMNPEGYVNAFWDYFGDNSITFENMTVTGVELASGGLITNPAQDSVIGTTVNLAGNRFGDVRTSAILVDTDPVDAFTSQIFSDLFSLTQGSTALMQGTGNNPAYSYWLNYWRNLVEGGDNGCSAVWQFTIPNDNLVFNGISTSPYLQALQQAAQQGQGVMVRFCTYLFEHIGYQEIADRFKDGNYDPTSARMIIVGCIGSWDNGELQSVPMARVMNPIVNLPIPVKNYVTPDAKEIFFLGPTLAKVDTTRKVIVLDMVSTIPEIAEFHTMDPNNTPANTPEKVNLGDIRLSIINQYPGYNELNLIATIPFQGATIDSPAYNKAAYLNRAGIVEIPYDVSLESKILSGNLALQWGMGDLKAPLLAEENPLVVLTDSRGVYLEGENAGQYISVPLTILQRGVPAPQGITLAVTQSVNADYPSTTASADLTPATPPTRASHTRFRTNQVVVEDTSDQIVIIPPSITVGPNGQANLLIAPYQQGLCKVWINTPDDPDINSMPDPENRYFMQGETFYYVNVRVLPDDRNLDSVSNPTWAFMYDNFFGYYSLMYPAMNTHINFDNEQQTTANASLIKNFVASANRASTLYMPITRELSAGKRRLVQRWASQHE